MDFMYATLAGPRGAHHATASHTLPHGHGKHANHNHLRKLSTAKVLNGNAAAFVPLTTTGQPGGGPQSQPQGSQPNGSSMSYRSATTGGPPGSVMSPRRAGSGSMHGSQSSEGGHKAPASPSTAQHRMDPAAKGEATHFAHMSTAHAPHPLGQMPAAMPAYSSPLMGGVRARSFQHKTVATPCLGWLYASAGMSVLLCGQVSTVCW